MSDDDGEIDIFQEPEGYRAAAKPHTTQVIVLKGGQELTLRLVGHNPLWADKGHLLWNAGRTITKYLEEHAGSLIRDRTILELGAGAGLPGIACAINGASRVVLTDYPDAELIDNLHFNIDHAASSPSSAPTPLSLDNIAAVGYLWGADAEPLVAMLPSEHGRASAASTTNHFDTVILADLLFNHVCHPALLDTICMTLRRSASARALVFFTPYRPWLLDKDLAFFDLVRETRGEQLEVVELGRWMMDEVLFKEDRGDETLRRTVFGFEIKWRSDYLATLPGT